MRWTRSPQIAHFKCLKTLDTPCNFTVHTYVFEIWGQPSLRNVTLVFVMFIGNILKSCTSNQIFQHDSITSKNNFDTFDTSQPLCLQEWYALRRIFEVCLLWFNETFLLCFSSFYFCRFYWICVYNSAKILQKLSHKPDTILSFCHGKKSKLEIWGS